MDIKELKVMAYDLMASIEQGKAHLVQVNQEIAQKMQEARKTKPQPKIEKKPINSPKEKSK